ncbi:hypothetical protein GC722_00430 [Auraticoccus sp. F435]|uniref:DUF3558 domain-containing protein n=1 Tax=Auraticoccus cholistanensis TaxID=2656650 RepID=A0A6A9UPP2_9ACTN|nr:hypothetical protein [Auraticoccus cholistanensis]MVA74508.1 hypothetical protein [Auraticoccus cholistanensis]
MRRRLLLLLVALTTLGGCLLTDEIDPEDPGEPEVREAAARAEPPLRALLDAVRGERPPLATAAFDVCDAGQHNWKIDTEWDWHCSLELVVVVDGGDVETGLREQQRLAEAAGCTSTYNSAQHHVEDAEWLITRYWRQFGSRPDYTASDLPGLRYECLGGVQLEAHPSDDQDDDPLPAHRQNPAPPLATTPEGVDASRQYFRYDRPTDADIDQLWTLQQGRELTLVLTAVATYHRD